MLKNRFSSQRRRIHAFAKAWAKAKLGPGPHRPQSIAIKAHVVSDYATNWLAQHGEMPTGVHTARATRPLWFCSGSFSPQEVDFTPFTGSKNRRPSPTGLRLYRAARSGVRAGRWFGPSELAAALPAPVCGGARDR